MDTDQIEATSVDEAIELFKYSLENVQSVLIEKYLFAEYRERIEALENEEDQLEEERQTLAESSAKLQPVSEAKVRILLREADDAAALGDVEGATAKRTEASNVEQQYDGIGARIEQIGARRQSIRTARRRIGHEIWEEAYPNLPTATFAVIEGTLNLLDGLKSGMFEYEALVGLQGLVTRPSLEKLVPAGPGGPSRQLASRVRQWFG